MFHKIVADCDAFILAFNPIIEETLQEVKDIYKDIVSMKQKNKVPILIVASTIESDTTVTDDNQSELSKTCPNTLFCEFTPLVEVNAKYLNMCVE